MNRKIVTLTLCIIVTMLSVCVSVKGIPYETTARQPKPVDYPIEIYESKGLNRPFKVIGIVQANAGKRHSVSATLEELRIQARKMGGDALIDLTNQPIGAGVPTSSGGIIYSGHVREFWQAKVIVWESTNQ